MADNPSLLSLATLAIISLHFVISAAAESDQDILIRFKDSLQNNEKLSSWNVSTSPCTNGVANWVGVICTSGDYIHGLKLENMDLSGELNITILKDLANLRTISFKHNGLTGALPSVNELGALKSVYFSYNNFNGEIADYAFDGMMSLKKVHLGHNEFVGKIPSSLAKLPRLLDLRLEDNHFQGHIPEFVSKELTYLNVSNNDLDGPIPEGLRDLDMSSFSGNENLCGGKLAACPESAASVSAETDTKSVTNSQAEAVDEHKSHKASFIMGAVAVGIIILITAIVCVLKSGPSRGPATTESPSSEKSGKKNSPKNEASYQMDSEAGHSLTSIGGGKKDQQTKLTFLKDGAEKFDLQDLLQASAEILGNGVFGSSYKADIVSKGPAIVVKRYRHMNNMDKDEFQEHMRRLGRLDHPNLLSLVAFCYRKEEKLMISHFVPNGSLAVHLHEAENAGLDWPTRLKIVKGVASGLSVLYKELPSLTTPHGHLKSSNVLLNESYEPLLTDYGLVPLVNQEHAQKLMIAYKSPEYLHHGRITKKTDVWALGTLILETLTGKFLQENGEKEFDLASWVSNMVEEDKTEEVFDKEMKFAENSKGQMVKLMQIGLACSHSEVEMRLDLNEAVEKIEELDENDTDK